MSRQPRMVREILRLIDFYRYALDRITGEQAARYAKLAQQVEQQILDLVTEGGSDKITRAKVNAIAKSLREIFANGKREVMQLTLQDSLEIAGVALRRTAELHATFESAASARAIRDTNALQAFLRFEDDIRSRRLLQLVEPYATRWARSWSADEGNWNKVAARVQAHFVRGEREGWSVHQLAEHMREVGELRVVERRTVNIEQGAFRMRGHMSPEAFAKGFARAKSTDLSTQVSIRLGREARLDKFANAGVQDDRQSEECATACSRMPMTLEEWDKTPEGRPPRHVLHCRDVLFAVPESVAQEWVPQINRTVLEAA